MNCIISCVLLVVDVRNSCHAATGCSN